MTAPTKISFNHADAQAQDFASALRGKVEHYFTSNNISKQGNAEMYVKTVCMLSLFFLPFATLVYFEPAAWLAFILLAVMGSGMAGVGLSVMHDGIHGAYAKHRVVNQIMGYTLNLVGGLAINWKIQHNIKHHSYTNIEDHDEDIEPKALLRLHPRSALKPVHRYQDFYAWFFYALGTLFWVTFKDFAKIARYTQEGILAKNTRSVGREYVILLFSKAFYYGYIIGLPIWFTAYSLGEILLSFLVMHLVAGLVLGLVFQPSHLMSGVGFFSPHPDGRMPHSRLTHQLHTSVNFANTNKLLTWYCGALNFQIEHHLFPHICHVHYRALAPLVKQTAQAYQLPYHSKSGFFEALRDHAKMLKWLGTHETVETSTSQ